VRQDFAALVVDDDDFSRRTAMRILQKLGAGSVAEAADGDEALRQATTGEPPLDLIVCDLKMPQRDGIETLRGIAAANLSALIVLASGADARVLRSARDMAATFGLRSLRAIEKPVTIQKLRDVFADVASSGAAPAVPRPVRTAPSGVTPDDIWAGLKRGEFAAHFQPKVHMASRRVVGAEALVRWVHPRFGLLSPAAFFAALKTPALFAALTEAMFDKSVERCAALKSAGLTISISVNLPVTCLSDRDLPQRFEEVARHHGVDPDQMILEVTEDGWLQNASVAREVLTRLRVMGFHLSIDDFGTGYSTMQQLLQAPFCEMKIDQCFVRCAPDDLESAIVLKSSVALAHSLKLSVVGEGAETLSHWNMLAGAGCDVVQGYFVARPMPGDELQGWIAAWDRRTTSASL
jgi:EAL domain-containing protein (putative c-di-GMP-specific phosphodiesterase class I)